MGIETLAVAAAALIAPYAKTAGEALVKGLGESAARAVAGLLMATKDRFGSTNDRAAVSALESAAELPADSREFTALAEALERHLRDDEAFRSEISGFVATAGTNQHLAEVMNAATTAITGAQFVNVISGQARVGNIQQVGKIDGGVTFN